jgi:glycosyltransferase involved in cell wall biosynthesis
MISIALAAYNGEKYIKEQIDSILNQTYQDFELIVCDDCSNDSTWAILKDCEQRDSRIHCYLNEENLGFNKNFEKAFKLCRGEYIAMSDQDDVWTEDHLEVLLENIGDNLICCGESMLFNENGEKMYKYSEIYDNISLADTAEKKVLRILYAGNIFAGACMLVKRTFLQRMLPIPAGKYAYDGWFVLCALCVYGQNSFLYLPAIVRYYRIHDSNVTGKHEKITVRYIFKNFSSIIRGRSFDRIYHCIELLKRYNDIGQGMKDILLSAEDYHRNSSNNFYRIKRLHFFIKNFPYIYLTRSKKMFFLRLIQYIFF